MKQSNCIPLDKAIIRRMNLCLLECEVGSMVALAKLCNTNRSQLAQSASPKINRVITDEIAERLEYATKKPKGWMDELHVDKPHLVLAAAIYKQLVQLPLVKVEALAILLDVDLSGHTFK